MHQCTCGLRMMLCKPADVEHHLLGLIYTQDPSMTSPIVRPNCRVALDKKLDELRALLSWEHLVQLQASDLGTNRLTCVMENGNILTKQILIIIIKQP